MVVRKDKFTHSLSLRSLFTEETRQHADAIRYHMGDERWAALLRETEAKLLPDQKQRALGIMQHALLEVAHTDGAGDDTKLLSGAHYGMLLQQEIAEQLRLDMELAPVSQDKHFERRIRVRRGEIWKALTPGQKHGLLIKANECAFANGQISQAAIEIRLRAVEALARRELTEGKLTNDADLYHHIAALIEQETMKHRTGFSIQA
jgi:hypothetical protein